MSNFYEVLDIEKSADEEEIKRAYVKLLRKYPPEKAPEEFKKIRRAYEELIDPISKAEYDAFSQYGDLIEGFDRIGKEALERKDYKAAINTYKKILIIEPNLAFAKNMLGLSLLYDGQYHEAKEQFEELVKISPDNATYYENLALAYRQISDYDRAEQAIVRAYELDPIDNNIVIVLVRIYVDKKEYDKAISFLEDRVGKNKVDEFQDLIYYLEMIKIYIHKNNSYKIEEIIDKIKEIIPDNENARKYVALQLGRIAYELYELTAYRLATTISGKALEICYNDDLKKLFDASKELYVVYSAWDRLKDDDRIIDPIKGLIGLYIYGEELEKEELDRLQNIHLETIGYYLTVESSNVISSIEILREEYNILYIYRHEFYDKIYKIAQDNVVNTEPSTEIENERRATGAPSINVADQTFDTAVENIESTNIPETESIPRVEDAMVESLSEGETVSKVEGGPSQNAPSDGKMGCLTLFVFATLGAAIGQGFGLILGVFLGLYVTFKYDL